MRHLNHTCQVLGFNSDKLNAGDIWIVLESPWVQGLKCFCQWLKVRIQDTAAEGAVMYACMLSVCNGICGLSPTRCTEYAWTNDDMICIVAFLSATAGLCLQEL